MHNQWISVQENPLPLLGAFFAQTKDQAIKEDLLERIRILFNQYNPWERPEHGPYKACVDYLCHQDATSKEKQLLLECLHHKDAPPPSSWHTYHIEVPFHPRKSETFPLPIPHALACIFPSLVSEYVKAGGSLNAKDQKGKTVLAYLDKDDLDLWFEQAQKQGVSLFYDDLSNRIEHERLMMNELVHFHKAALKAFRKYPVHANKDEPEHYWSSILELIRALQGKNTIAGQIKTLGCEANLKDPQKLAEMADAFMEGYTPFFQERGYNLYQFPKDQQSGIVTLSKYILRLLSSSKDPSSQQKAQEFKTGLAISSYHHQSYAMSSTLRRYLQEARQQVIEHPPADQTLYQILIVFKDQAGLSLDLLLNLNNKNLSNVFEKVTRATVPHVELSKLDNLLRQNTIDISAWDLPKRQQLGRLCVDSLFNRYEAWSVRNSLIFHQLATYTGVNLASTPNTRSFPQEIKDFLTMCLDDYFQSPLVKDDPLPPSNDQDVNQVLNALQNLTVKSLLNTHITSTDSPSLAKKKM